MDKKGLFDFRNLTAPKKTVTCSVPTHIEEELMVCANKSGRSKKREAEMRLEDHVRRFSSIEQLGVVTERSEDKKLD